MEDTASDQLPKFWAIEFLCFPEGPLRDEGRRITALNFCTHAETGLGKDWEKQFETVLAKLKGETPSNVTAFKPKVVEVDNSG